VTSADELVDAVAGWIEHDLVPTLEGQDAFQARVALHALRIVGRELTSDAPAVDRSALAAAAREGTLTPDDHQAVVRDVLARIAVDSPGYATVEEAGELWPDLALG
jgi:hypothetical protein